MHSTQKTFNQMSYIFSKQSIEALERCRTDLQRIAESSLERSQIDFAVVEGHRSVARQQLYLVPTEDALYSKKPFNQMSYIFSKQSIEALEHCRTDLQRIAESSLERSQIDFAVVEERRSVARQQLHLVPTEDALYSKNLLIR